MWVSWEVRSSYRAPQEISWGPQHGHVQRRKPGPKGCGASSHPTDPHRGAGGSLSTPGSIACRCGWWSTRARSILTIPRTTATRSGLFCRVARRDRLEVGAAGGSLPATGRLLVGDLEIGSRILRGQAFVETEDGQYPTLGLPALTSYDLQIFPGRRLFLRSRNPDMRATAAARVGRWPWMPSCRLVGCARAYVEGTGDDGRIIFEIEAVPPRPVSILFACREITEADRVRPPPLDQHSSPNRPIDMSASGSIRRRWSRLRVGCRTSRS